MSTFKEYLNEHRKAYDNDIAYLYQKEQPLFSIKNEIENTYGYSISLPEIYRSLKRVGIQPNRRANPYRDDVVYFNQNGFGLEEISQLTGYSTRHIRNILKIHKDDLQDGNISE